MEKHEKLAELTYLLTKHFELMETICELSVEEILSVDMDSFYYNDLHSIEKEIEKICPNYDWCNEKAQTVFHSQDWVSVNVKDIKSVVLLLNLHGIEDSRIRIRKSFRSDTHAKMRIRK